jgi:hypothetical protein
VFPTLGAKIVLQQIQGEADMNRRQVEPDRSKMNQLRLCSAEVHASMRSLSPQLSHVLVGNCRSFVAEALRYVVGDRSNFRVGVNSAESRH